MPSAIIFTTSRDADDNLIQEGQPKEKIFMVGNLMIDSLVANLGKLLKPNYVLLHLIEHSKLFRLQFIKNNMVL